MGRTPVQADHGSTAATPIRWLTPPQLARERGIRVSHILKWIHSGELEAVNLALKRNGRPRWRISAEALKDFERRRSNVAVLAPTRSRLGRRDHAGVVEWF